MSQKSATRGVSSTLQDAATTGNGTVLAIPPSFHEHQIIIKGSAGIASGAVQVEAADAADYAGTWAVQTASPTTVVASTEITIHLTGVFSFIRARISTNVVGGTVTVVYKGS